MPSKNQLEAALGRSRGSLERAKPHAITLGGTPYTVGLSHGTFEIEAEGGVSRAVKGITFLLSKALLPAMPAIGAAVVITDPAESGTYSVGEIRDQGEHWLLKAMR